MLIDFAGILSYRPVVTVGNTNTRIIVCCDHKFYNIFNIVCYFNSVTTQRTYNAYIAYPPLTSSYINNQFITHIISFSRFQRNWTNQFYFFLYSYIHAKFSRDVTEVLLFPPLCLKKITKFEFWYIFFSADCVVCTLVHVIIIIIYNKLRQYVDFVIFFLLFSLFF